MLIRHQLVWLSASGWQAAQARAAPEQRAILLRWQEQDWPLTVRRNAPDTQPGQVCLGLTAHSDAGVVLRIALRAMVSEVMHSSPTLPLTALLDTLPQQWRPDLAALAHESTSMALHVSGPLVLHLLTGQSYHCPAIDLLFYPTSGSQLRRGLTLLNKYAKILPLDGEIIFPDNRAVVWKELLELSSARALIRVKDQYSVRLMPVNKLLASLHFN